jgi:hypothetical protein
MAKSALAKDSRPEGCERAAGGERAPAGSGELERAGAAPAAPHLAPRGDDHRPHELLPALAGDREYFIPRRYKWLITANQGNRGSPINQKIIDNTGTIALRICASGMMAGITSPGRPWFRLSIDNAEVRELPPVKLWLDEVTKRMMTVFAESNFYQALATMYGDLAAFGTHAMVMREDYDDVIRCYSFALGEYCLANDMRLQVNTCYRQFVMTAAAGDRIRPRCLLRHRAGVGEQGRGARARDHREPRDRAQRQSHAGLGGLKDFPFREVYWEQGQGTQKRCASPGLHEYALIAPRWDIVGNDAYGRSPGMDALGDVKQLQVEQKRKAQAIDKLVNPPMVADIALKNQPASLLPGGVTYVANSQGVGFKPAYEVKPELGAMIEDIREVQGRVTRTFFNDLFLMISQMDGVQPRNEMEIARAPRGEARAAGPGARALPGRGARHRDRAHLRHHDARGAAAADPKELGGQFVKPEYISILAQAQRAAMTAGLERFAAFVGRIAAGQNGIQGVGPEAMDNVDWDEVCQQYADMLGVPEKVIRAFTDVMKIRQMRAKQQQAAQAMQAGMAAVQGAKVLSETDVGGGQNALQRMVA